ncbi:hypothetical protein HZA39_03115 [Candidatus Peregrinibacteria bacterium]|nr:hypothetical protein [Candidatus Peregrinibacteria bacterium]
MDLTSQANQLIATTGFAGYLGLAALGIFYIAGMISVFLAIGMFFYSLFSKNWKVWRFWKYIGYAFLVGFGFLVLSVIVSVISGMMN